MLHHALSRSFLVWFWLTGALLSVSSLSLRGAEPATHDFDVPGGEARPMLQRFAAQANVEIVFPVDSVRGIRTNAVKGRMTVRDAIGRMLSSTGLVAAFDEATGAIAVRVDGRRANSAATAATAVARATTAPGTGEREAAAGSGPASATISGQVSNAATKAYLEGAVVEWLGSGRSVTTDRNGRYRFTGVSNDQVVLAVSFTGLDSQRVVVPLQPGANVVRDVALTSDVYQLEKFTVAGEREGTARSEVLQRMAPNVKSVISSDTFGNIADGNIGDLLQRMPGITGEYNGTDVRQVSIRGVTSNLNSVTMDGQQVADSQSAGTGRGFEFQAVSMANIESIEVTKAPTPDMDGASIGGSVNLVSKSAFDRAPGRVFTYTVGFATRDGYNGSPDRSWKEPVKGFGPSLSFGYSDLVGARRNLGITFTGTLHSQPGGGMTLANQYERRATPGPVFNYSTTRQTGGFGTTRSRYALALKLDYKWSEHTTMAFNTSYNFFHANNDTRSHQLATTGTVSAANPQVLATVDAGGNRIGGGFIAPGYTSDFTRVFAGPRSLSTITINSFDKTVRTYLFAPSFRHRYDGLSIDYNFTYSNSATYQDVSHRGEKYHAAPTGTITLELPNIGWTVDRAGNSTWPTIRQVQGPDLYDVGNYGNLLLTQIDLRGYDSILGAKFDLKKELRLALPTYLKSGFTYQRQTRKVWQDPRRFRFAGADGVLGNADDSTGIRAFAYTGEPTEEEERYLAGRGGIPAWVDPRLVAQNQVDQPQRWVEDVAFTSGKLTSYRHMQEDIAAAYIMGNVRYRDLSLLTGVRVEQTRGDGEGALSYISPEERARRAAWTGPLTDAEILRRNLAQYGTRATNEGKYNSVLPGVHLKYEPFRGFVGRLSWSTGIGRPPFGNIVPNTVINDEARSISVTNPELKPQRANNYDFSAEYYFRRQGMVSVGFFRKEITDYIDTDSSQVVAAGEDNGFDGEFVGYRVNTSRNNGEATIEGMEISYQQQLSFLPGWARGLGVYGNFTKLRTEGNNSAFRTGATVSNSGTLAGFLNESGNIGVSYRGYDLELRLQAVYRGEYLISNSTDPSQRVYQRSKVTWAWKSRYNLTRHVGLFLDLENLFAQPLDHTFAAYRDRPTTYRTFHTKIVGGLTGRF